MIQRIQTVYLTLASTAMGMMFFIPILKFIGEPDFFYTPFGFKADQDDMSFLGDTPCYSGIILALVVLIMVLQLLAIVQFKNRNLQMNLCKGAMFFQAGIVAALLFIISSILTPFKDTHEIGYGIGYFLPIVSLILTALALSAIRKDEKLVKSLDRLR